MNLYEAQQALDKAADCLDDSAYNLSDGRTIVTVNRAYYAIYYCICCLLLTENQLTKTHQGAQSKFSELFVKTGRFPTISAKWISMAFNLRQLGDYDFDPQIGDSEAHLALEQATLFYDLTKQYFESQFSTSPL